MRHRAMNRQIDRIWLAVLILSFSYFEMSPVKIGHTRRSLEVALLSDTEKESFW